MGCSASIIAAEEATLSVVIFGATGMVGGAVARTLLQSSRFKVKAVTRNPTSKEAQCLAEEGAVLGTADLNDPHSLERVVRGCDVMFLVTHYWEHMNKSKEMHQGINAVDVAVKCKVKHLVFCGAECVFNTTGSECGHMDAKSAIEEYIKDVAIPHTILRLPFLYENFLSVFRPHNIRDDVYAITIPLEGVALDCMGVHDMSKCVMNLFLRPRYFLCKTLGLVAERLTTQNMADTLQKHLDEKKIIVPNLRVKDYKSFDFKGSVELAAMFEFFQTGKMQRDLKITKRLNGSLMSFERWVIENKDKIESIMCDKDYTKQYTH